MWEHGWWCEEEASAVVAFRAKMETEQAKQIYRQRGPVAEFQNAWIKAKIGLRQFRLRGLLKVSMEATWARLTYNIQQWIQLRWGKEVALGTTQGAWGLMAGTIQCRMQAGRSRS